MCDDEGHGDVLPRSMVKGLARRVAVLVASCFLGADLMSFHV